MSGDQMEDPIAEFWRVMLAEFGKYGGLNPHDLDGWSSASENGAPVRLPESTARGWRTVRVPTTRDRMKTLLMFLESLRPADHEGPKAQDIPAYFDLWRAAIDHQRKAGDPPAPPGHSPAPKPQSPRPLQPAPKPQPPKSWLRRRAKLLVAGAASVLIAVVLSPPVNAWHIFVDRAHDSSGASTQASSVWWCSRVNHNAQVYPAPNTHTKPIKSKAIGDVVDVLLKHYPHPPGWLVVRTPRDPPGFGYQLAAHGRVSGSIIMDNLLAPPTRDSGSPLRC